MRAVWKYDIPIFTAAAEPDGYAITMPRGAQFLHSAVQHIDDQISAWFEVRPDAIKERRFFRVFGTGHPVDDPTHVLSTWQYRGTTLHHGGSLVLHLYELGLPS